MSSVPCRRCGEPVGLRDSRCRECHIAMPADDKRRTKLRDDKEKMALVRAHARREHVGLPRLDCPVCRRFPTLQRSSDAR